MGAKVLGGALGTLISRRKRKKLRAKMKGLSGSRLLDVSKAAAKRQSRFLKQTALGRPVSRAIEKEVDNAKSRIEKI